MLAKTSKRTLPQNSPECSSQWSSQKYALKCTLIAAISPRDTHYAACDYVERGLL